MRGVVALALGLAAFCFAWMASEQIELLPPGDEDAMILQGPARVLAGLSVFAAFAAGLLI